MNFATLVNQFFILFNSTIRLLSLVAVALFFYAGFRYVWGAANEKKNAQNKIFLLWGIIALFVLFSLGGIIAVVQKSLGIQPPPKSVDQTNSNFSGLPTSLPGR